MSGDGPDLLNDDEEGQFNELQRRNGRMEEAAQKRLLQSLVGAAQWSIARQNHQIAYGGLVKQRKELRARTLEQSVARIWINGSASSS